MTPTSFISFPIFKKYPDLLCAFSTRRGGVSQKPYDSLNLGKNTGDDINNVERNRNIFFSAISVDASNIAFTDQVHSAQVRIVHSSGIYRRTDGLIFIGRGIFLAVQTADCFPIFIYVPQSQTVAVIHAGWRGIVDHIVENTFSKLTDQCGINPTDCLVAVGPGMQSECFEVREDVYNNIPDRFIYPHPSPERKYLDLRELISVNLSSCGVLNDNIYCADLCTKCESTLFYSYRRDGVKSGRMMGIIGLRL